MCAFLGYGSFHSGLTTQTDITADNKYFTYVMHIFMQIYVNGLHMLGFIDLMKPNGFFKTSRVCTCDHMQPLK